MDKHLLLAKDEVIASKDSVIEAKEKLLKAAFDNVKTLRHQNESLMEAQKGHLEMIAALQGGQPKVSSSVKSLELKKKMDRYWETDPFEMESDGHKKTVWQVQLIDIGQVVVLYLFICDSTKVWAIADLKLLGLKKEMGGVFYREKQEPKSGYDGCLELMRTDKLVKEMGNLNVIKMRAYIDIHHVVA